MESTWMLPERCLAASSSMRMGYGGYLLSAPGSRGPGGSLTGLIVLPSTNLIEEYEKQGKLPPGVFEALEQHNNKFLEELTDQQRCLAAGFTEQQCEKLGNKLPKLTQKYIDVGRWWPVSRYDASPEQIN